MHQICPDRILFHAQMFNFNKHLTHSLQQQWFNCEIKATTRFGQ